MSQTTDWKSLGQAFENLGMQLYTDCENLDTICEADDTFQPLYFNYVQLLETIKVQIRVLQERFDQIDDRGGGEWYIGELDD